MTTLTLTTGLSAMIFGSSFAQKPGEQYNNADYKLKAAEVVYESRIDALVFEVTVEGQAGKTVPKPVGSMSGAPVLGYVFPTTLKSRDVGFSATEGIVAMALTAHPDMDDTPLWDENADGKYDNDGVVWHAHWVVLTKDERVPGGLSVKEFKAGDKTVELPKTAPGLPFFFDSPGFNVISQGPSMRVVVPSFRVHHQRDFKFDAVACYMQMSHSDGHHKAGSEPMLGVYNVFGVLSGNLSLPYTVKK
ncbi:hypothetical protein [Dyadobacter beijingensis]|nr:hypothetical protein [Dyadobacter beijingensis]